MKNYNNFLNESNKPLSLGKERMIKFLEKIAEIPGYRFAYEIAHDIRNNHLNVELHKKNYILYNNQEMRVGKFFKKYFTNKTESDIESLVFRYNEFMVKITSEKFKNGVVEFSFIKFGKKSELLDIL
jgi:hypothetical protein